MKVLQIIDILDVGGAERIFITMCNLMRTRKMDVSALVFGRKGILEDTLIEEIPKVPFRRTSKWNIKEWSQLAKILKKYDILHVHMRHNFVYIKLIAKVFRVKTKIILHDHSSEFDQVSSSLRYFLKPKYFIGVSSKLVNWAKAILKVQEHNAFLLYNVIVRERVESTDYKEGIVVVGNIKPGKNQLFVVELLPFLKTKVTFIGKVQDLEYFNLIKNRIRTLQLEDNVTFLTDIHDVQHQLPTFNLALMPSTKESGPLVLVEFLAQDLPFVSYKTGEISQQIANEIPDFFVSSFEKEIWLDRIQTISNYEKQDLISVYEKYFSPSQYIQLCTEIYQKILNS